MFSLLFVLSAFFALGVNAGAIAALKYTHVGGSGSYDQVTNMIAGTWPSCTVNPSCIKSSKSVSGNLAPFNEEVTMVFRGPMKINNIAVYQPSSPSAGTWTRTSSWNKGSAPSNLVFMNNKGGGKSGVWDTCHGNSQSYANGDWTDAASGPNAETYSGTLKGGNEVNIVTGTSCASSPCSGFSRGTASHGWSSSKMFVVNFEMPSDGTSNLPAIWILNSQVTNSAQYGCNCRNMGANGGCGELDVLETLSGNVNNGITEIYSFKGATGSGNNNWFPRPTSGAVTYAVVMDVQTDAIVIQKLGSWNFGQGSVTRSTIDGLLNVQAVVVPF